MKLDTTPAEQLEAMIDWMLEQANLAAPGPAEHAERSLAMKEHAWFAREIVLPKIQVAGRMATLSIAEGVNGMPQRPDNLKRNNGFLSAGLPNEEQARDEAEGTGPVRPVELLSAIPGATA